LSSPKDLFDRRFVLLVGISFATAGYSVYVGGDSWEWMGYSNRFLSIGLPSLLILASVGFFRLARRDARVELRPTVLAAGIGIIVAGLAYGLLTPSSVASAGDLLLGDYSLRRLLFLAALVVLLLWLIAVRLRQGIRPVLAVDLTPFVLYGLLQGQAYWDWIRTGGFHVKDDEIMARVGGAIRDLTPPETRVAVEWAGGIPYYSHRFTVDLLGRTDKVIARTALKGAFFPGHDKWDFRYSLATYQPDLVLFYRAVPEGDAALVLAAGYSRHRVGRGEWYVRRESEARLAGLLAQRNSIPFGESSR
jgi:hypothetical protein